MKETNQPLTLAGKILFVALVLDVCLSVGSWLYYRPFVHLSVGRQLLMLPYLAIVAVGIMLMVKRSSVARYWNGLLAAYVVLRNTHLLFGLVIGMVPTTGIRMLPAVVFGYLMQTFGWSLLINLAALIAVFFPLWSQSNTSSAVA